MEDVNLTQQFVYKMTEGIIGEKWPVGNTLPSFRDLAKEYGVSRSVINTAIAVLENKGYVEIVTRKGAVVRDWKKEGTVTVLNDAISLGYFQPDLIDSFFSLLNYAECNGVFEAASKAKEEDIFELKITIEKEAVERNAENLVNLYLKFHEHVATMSNNIAYCLIFASLKEAFTKIAQIYTLDGSAKQQCFKMHKDIFQSLKDHDGQKAKWEMQELLDHLRVLVTYKTCNLKEK
jgi:DNA-binding FadR family transcriptional regulator